MKDLIRKFEPLALFAVILASVYIFFFYPMNSKIGFGQRTAGEFEQEKINQTAAAGPALSQRGLVALNNQALNNEALDPASPPASPAAANNTDGNAQTAQPWKDNTVQNPQGLITTFQNPTNMQAMIDKNAAAANDPFGLKQAAAAAPQLFNTQKVRTMPVTVPEKMLQEGHWIGLEVVPLTKALAKANNIPRKIEGVLIDEVTLLSAETGLLAGDVISSINNNKVIDLKSFSRATKPVANTQQAVVKVYRNGNYYDISVFGPDVLGIAQMEAAPMINPTSPSPHGYYGPCSQCHTLTNGPLNTGQLTKDMGDQLLKVPPPIKWGAEAPHRNRGVCTDCHNII